MIGDKRSKAILDGQRKALEAALGGADLETSLGILVETARGQFGGDVRAAFYLANADKTGLQHVVGMEPGYAAAVHNFRIGPDSLSCGLATHTGQPVLTADVKEEPLWNAWVWVAEKFDFRGCWSFPISNRSGEYVGTLAFYWREPRTATAEDVESAAHFTQSAAIIIAHHTESILREKAEATLRDSEEKYRTLFESIDEGFCTIEVLFDDAGNAIDYRFLQVSPSFERQTGLKDAVGKRMRELEPELENHWFEIYGRIALTGEPERFENRADALGRWYDVYAFRIGEPQRRQVGVLFNDIKNRKLIEAALRESEERQAFLLKLSDALRPLADPAEALATAARLLGEHLRVGRIAYAEAEADGETLVVLPTWHVEGMVSLDGWRMRPSDYDRGRAAALRSGLTQVTRDTQADPEIESGRRAAYAAAYIGATIAVPLVKDGKLLAILGAHDRGARDWTPGEILLVEEVAERTWSAIERARVEAALRAREAELARVQQIGRVAGIDIDLANGMTTNERSREYKLLHGLSSRVVSETHQDWLNRLHPDDRQRADRSLREAVATGTMTYNNEYRIIRPDDRKVRWISAKGEIERDEEGQAIRLIGAHIDITERKLAEEALAVELTSMQRLQELAQRALVATKRTVLFDDLLAAAMSLHGADHGLLQIFNSDTGRLSVGAHKGLKQAFLDQFADIGPDAISACGMALRDRARVVIEDVEEADFLKPVLKVVRAARIRAGQSTPLFSVSGELVGMLSTYFSRPRQFTDSALRLTDIFARLAGDAIAQMRIDEALKASEHHLERVLESISDGLIVVSADNRITYTNPASRQMLAARGVDADGMIGQDYRTGISAIAGAEGIIRFQQVMDGREDAEFEFYHGDWKVWYAVRAFPVREGGISIYYHDITDRKTADALVRESGERLKRLMESISDFFIVVGEDWTLQSANAAARVFFEGIGVDPESILGRDLWQSFPEMAGTELEHHYRQAMRQRIPVNFEFFHALVDRWYGIRVYPIVGDGISVYMQDITTRKQAEATLAASEDGLQRLVESIADIFLVVGKDWTYKYANEAAREVIIRAGKRPEDIIGREVWEAYPHLIGTPLEQAMRDTMYERKPISIEHVQGDYCYLSHFYPVEGDGISVFTQDITERKRIEEDLRDSEARWKALTNAMPQIVWIGRADTGDCEYVNEQFSHYTGAPNESFLGHGWQYFVHPEDRGMAVVEWQRARDRSDIFDVEFRMRRADAAFRWFKVRGVPMAGTDGEIKLWYGTCTDIQDTMEARFRAESADRAKSEFLANMSHEIRTPLNAIIGLTSIMLQFESEPEMYRQYLTTMNDSAASLAQLINDVLEFARIDAGIVELHEAEFHPVSLMDEVLRIASVKAQEKGLTTHLHCDLAPEAGFIGDAQRIRQIMLNLLGNAVKFTDMGHVDLIIASRDEPDGRTLISATVRDTGIGIDADKLEHIFGKFTQADASITRRYGGTGLGLAISRRLAETMGGTIRVRSERGAGSSFTLEIPLRAAGEAVPVTQPKTIDTGLKARRVLLVEDNPTNVIVAGAMLKRLGYEYETATDGRQAVQTWQKGRFDLILMDLQMPDMDGVQATRRIRQIERTSDVPPVTIIAMTAHALGEDRERCLAAGMNEYLAKPFTVEALAGKLEEIEA